ncbi:MAG: hypothetical protein HY298_13855 [Verrucomicrobia bacterium]|nr:hypothetical protein [Verrucomicrobiota bacterium]
MLKQLFDYVQQLLFLGRDTQKNRDDIEELRRELQQTNALVIELSHKLERLAERERLEREKLALQLENALLRFERRLPPAKEPKKLK